MEIKININQFKSAVALAEHRHFGRGTKAAWMQGHPPTGAAAG